MANLPDVTPTTDLIGTAEAAVILGWSRAKVKKAAQEGALPHAVKMTGRTGAYLFDRSTIEAAARPVEGAA